MTEGWDLGLMAEPPDAPLRCLVLHRADADSEAGKPRSQAAVAALASLTDEMRAAGVLLASERVRPSPRGHAHEGGHKKTTVIDGPFAESKEMIAGYIIMNAPSVAATQPWTARFAEVIGDVELDVLPLYESDSEPPSRRTRVPVAGSHRWLAGRRRPHQTRAPADAEPAQRDRARGRFVEGLLFTKWTSTSCGTPRCFISIQRLRHLVRAAATNRYVPGSTGIPVPHTPSGTGVRRA